jgi:HNH endonuclease
MNMSNKGLICSVEGCESNAERRRWCNIHYRRFLRHGDPLVMTTNHDKTFDERFWMKVDKNGPIPDYAPHLGPCWIWTASLEGGGYGAIGDGKKKKRAHRYSYEQLVGDIPDGLELDHLCRVRNCVRPDHLEPVTRRENVMRGISPIAENPSKTQCPEGHPYGGKNLIELSTGGRRCRTCRNEKERAGYFRRKERASSQS